MAEVTININGRSYDIACDNGQEGRVVDLAAYIDQRLQQISRSGAAYNDTHLMVLTLLVLADEIFDLRAGEQGPKAARAATQLASTNDDQIVLQALERLTQRIDGIASRVQSA